MIPAEVRLRVLTMNVLNIADRWPERHGLLRAGFVALAPDIAAMQEVFFPIDQDRLIADPEGTDYIVRRAWADRRERGNSLLIRRAITACVIDRGRPERFALGHGRSAVRTQITIAGLRIRLVVTHLHHVPADEPVRDAQVAALLTWLDRLPLVDAAIVAGDFNAEPDEIAARRMVEGGFRSAHAEATGADPAVTFPSGLQAPGREYYSGWPEGCLDYVWIAGRLKAVAAAVVMDQPAVDDPTLYPSDHRGIVVDLALS